MKGPIKVGSRMFKPIVFLMITFSFASLSCQGNKVMADPNSNGTEMELLVQESYSGFEEERLFLIKDRSALGSFYGIINRTRKPGLVPPAVDFNKEMLLVWCGGETASSGLELKISSTEKQLKVQKIIPKKASPESRTLVRPFRIYVVPLSSKTLVFE